MMKKVLYTHFRMFFIIFDHANACASMCLLVEIHNNPPLQSLWFVVFSPDFYLYLQANPRRPKSDRINKLSQFSDIPVTLPKNFKMGTKQKGRC